MPWGAAIGLATAYLSYDSAKEAGDRAEDAAGLEHEYRMRDLDLREEGLDFSKKQYAEHKARWDPVLDQLLAEYDDIEPDYQAIAGDIKSSFQSAREQQGRYNRRYGIRPDDGQARQSDLRLAIDESTAHVGARALARRGAKEMAYARKADLWSAGQGIMGNAANAVANQYSNAAAGYGNAANAANTNMRYYDNLAGQNAYGIGQSLGSVDWGAAWNKAKGWFNRPGGSGGSIINAGV